MGNFDKRILSTGILPNNLPMISPKTGNQPKINLPFSTVVKDSKLIPSTYNGLNTFPFLPECEGRRAEGGLRTKGRFKHNYKRVENSWWICNMDGDVICRAPKEIEENILKYIEYLKSKNNTGNFQINELPLITVITVVLNGGGHLEETMQSVLNQTYPNVEYIIVDGGSTDGTLDIIRKYGDRIDYWVSEKDKGIYDAMNKGIKVALGSWINFMNGGDGFYHMDVLEEVFTKSDWKDIDVIYGNHQLIRPTGKKIVKAGRIEDIWKGSQFCHQSAFVRTKIHRDHIFNTSITIAADFEFFYTLHKEKMDFKHLNIVIANYSAGGISDVRRIRTILEWWSVVEKNTRTNLHYLFLITSELLKLCIKTAVREIKKFLIHGIENIRKLLTPYGI